MDFLGEHVTVFYPRQNTKRECVLSEGVLRQNTKRECVLSEGVLGKDPPTTC
jgi:hypothetical protein